MKKVFLLFTGLICFQLLTAQDCEVKKDPFTNEEVVSYRYGKSLIYELKAGETTMEIVVAFGGSLKVALSAGSEVMFKLENGEIIKKTTIADAFPKSYVSGQAIYTNYPLKMVLTKTDIAKLANSRVDVMRYPDAKGGTFDWDIKGLGKLYAKNMQKGAQCMNEHQ